MDISDGDLVRLARDGDPAAFRLLVERHLPMARARAARLCPQPDDADDAVQDAFLQAFLALDRLRDPDRFAGWLGGIVANICRAQRRRAPLTLLGDWPENLHPAADGSLPSAEDLTAPTCSAARSPTLPPGQRQAVTLFYYADQPTRQIAGDSRRRQGQPAQGSPPAARVHHRAPPRPYPRRLPENSHDRCPHHARRPLARTHTRREDGYPPRARDPRRRRCPPGAAGPAPWPRTPALASAQPPRRPRRGPVGRSCRGDDQLELALQAAGVTLAGVTVTDLGPGVTVTRIGIAGPGGTPPVTANLADGLTLAAITGAPLAVDDPVMDRLARPITGPDLLSQFRSQETPPRSLGRRFEPRNMAFTDGLDRWEFGGSFLRQGTGLDYSATAEGGRAILAAAVPEPAGSAFLAQDIDADDYRGRTVTFRGELLLSGLSGLSGVQADGRAGLALRAASPGRSTPPRAASPDPWDDPANHIAFATGTGAWTQYEVTAQIPPDANLIRFGVFLDGGGQVELRHPELAPHPPGQQ